MSRGTLRLALLFVALAVAVAGCGSGPKRALLDVTATPPTLTADEAYQRVTAILVDKNFDIKQGQKDLGLITTEYKQFGSSGSNPPFDFYLQIRTAIKTRPDGKLSIKMIPAVKQQNRLNAAAFTEESLRYFDDKTIEKPMWLESADQVRLKGQLLFMNVVHAVSEASGVGVEQLEQNVAVLE